MNLKEIKKMLHHREPYIMVSEVIDLSKKHINSIKTHDGKEPYIHGHFPGAPIVPGAMLQEICTQSAAILLTKFYAPVESYDSELTKGHAIGVLNKIEYAKFLEIVKPDQDINVSVSLVDSQENLFKFKAIVTQSDRVKAKLKFNLVNISDEYLY